MAGEVVAWLCDAGDGENIDATARTNVRDDYARFRREIKPLVLHSDYATLVRERDRLREALEWYADPEIYKPHPHGPAFDDRDLSFKARAALAGEGS